MTFVIRDTSQPDAVRKNTRRMMARSWCERFEAALTARKDGHKNMVYIDETRIIQDTLKLHRKKLQRQEWEEASKEKRHSKAPELPYEIDESIFEHEEGCRCPDCLSSAIDAAEGEGYE